MQNATKTRKKPTTTTTTTTNKKKIQILQKSKRHAAIYKKPGYQTPT